MAKNRVVLTPEFRMSFANLISPKQFIDPKTKAPGKWSYNVEMIFAEADITKFKVVKDVNGQSQLVDVSIEAVLVDLAKEFWPGIVIKEAFAGVLGKGWPLRRADARADALKAKEKNGEHYRGMRVMSAKSNVSDKVLPPSLQIAVKGKSPTRINRMIEQDMQLAKQAFIGGNYAVAELNIQASEVSGMKYLTPYINLIRYTREGTKFGNQGGSLMERYDGVHGGESDHNPLVGAGAGDDEIPF